ncbi:ABC transporter substrate-binding protein [Pusillimonas sp. SM2304]|uniref:ABC transporter substrate-binding protein n=1 Tax=Pusillimonas sp. SM2304 TaxID=3073241 RepID=UPI0028766E66|nr:ABC transporter substrate-binding protein [Pusillimonas sp. SM2304]MDS1140416.1 ABC transporter substrate-binding protein [Pusillimonas sp. SM2304]
MKKRKLIASAIIMMAAAHGSVHAQEPLSVKLGVLNDLSGIGAELGGKGSIVAARLAAEDFQKAHPDVKVEVIFADHQNKADIGAATARRWYDQDGVDAILDVQTSSVALAVNAVTREKNKVFIGSGPGTTDLTGKACTPNTVHWTYDTWALANATGSALVKEGGKSWYFITSDYSFGHSLEKDTAKVVTEGGGKVLGRVLHPFGTSDYSSYILQAQSSGAQIIGMATSSGDLVSLVKQSSEFGVAAGGQRLAALLMFISDVHALGLDSVQGLTLSGPFYWDLNDGTRKWSQRFAEQSGGTMPTMVHAGVYAGAMHYLKAVAALKDKQNGAGVVEEMKKTPTDDPLFGQGEIRADGRKIHPMYLFQVKTPAESTGPWDYYKLLATIPADEVFRPLADGGCPLVK